jgi:hypothetical protein
MIPLPYVCTIACYNWYQLNEYLITFINRNFRQTCTLLFVGLPLFLHDSITGKQTGFLGRTWSAADIVPASTTRSIYHLGAGRPDTGPMYREAVDMLLNVYPCLDILLSRGTG